MNRPVEREERGLRPALYRLLESAGVVLLAFAGGILVGLAGTDTLVSLGLLERETVPFDVATSVLQFVGLAAGIGLYLAWSRGYDLVGYDRPSNREWLLVAAGLLALLAGQFGVGAALEAFGLRPGENRVIVIGQEDPTFFLYMIVVTVLLVGPIEELLFRGVVQGLLRRAMPAWPAILIATLLFGIVHIPAVTGGLGGAISYAFVAGLLGILLGWLYEYTRNIVVPALVHGLYNAMLFSIQYAVTTGLI